MKFAQLLDVVAEEPLFETGLLLAGDVDPAGLRRQLSRWTRAGRLHQLRRGLYALAPPFQRVRPHPFVVANRLVSGSYVSCQAALTHHHLIPEFGPVVTSLCAGRPGRRDTPLGRYDFRHLAPGLLYGYRAVDLGGRQQAFVASPEKALLDLVHLQPGGDGLSFLHGLRLQNLDTLDAGELMRLAGRSRRPKLMRAAENVVRLVETEALEYETL